MRSESERHPSFLTRFHRKLFKSTQHLYCQTCVIETVQRFFRIADQKNQPLKNNLKKFACTYTQIKIYCIFAKEITTGIYEKG